MKYTTEDNIDFFSQLYSSLDTSENNEKTENDNNCCLISGDLLVDRYVTMNCGHKFNYSPLFKDIMQHKLKFNSMESSNKLKNNQIRCPYCRNKQTDLLPYYEDMSFEKINGVNYYLSNIVSSSTVLKKHKNCEYVIPNPNYIDYESESSQNPTHNYCLNYASKFNKYNDTKNYCYTHSKIMVLKYKADIKEKELAIKEAAKKEKEELKKAKEDAKAELKATKLLKKPIIKQPKITEMNDDNQNENIVISDIKIVKEKLSNNLNKCKVIIKTGINKGQFCNCNVLLDETLCKRHYNLEQKKIKIEK
jgi:hypothetical protein